MIASRQTRICVDLDALTHNVRYYQNQTKKTIFGVVKANAYGHGDIHIAKHLESLDIPVLCVSSIDEARHLAMNGVASDILIFGPVTYESIEQYHLPQFIYTIASEQWYEQLPSSLENLRFHIEVNTGMNRLGFRDAAAIQRVLDSKAHRFEGLYTHFSSADDTSDFTNIQRSRFDTIVKSLDHTFKWIHSGNSHGAFIANEDYLNAARIGIGLYGYLESTLPEASSDIKQILRLESQIIHIDTLEAGEYVGYNRTFIANETTRFGTIPVGYADGLNPFTKDIPVYIDNASTRILGKLCMDQTMIEVQEHHQLGDWVEIIGPNRSAKAIADALQTIPYVVLAQLSDRIIREYYLNDKCIASIDMRNGK